MAIEFITSLSNSVLVKHSQNQPYRYPEEANRKIEIPKFNQEHQHKVTEKISSEPSAASILRFQENIPITNTLKTIRIFNESNKPSSVVSESSDDANEVPDKENEDSEESVTENKTEEIGKGYYIVTQLVYSPKGKLLPNSNEEVIRNRLKEIYNSNGKKENGSLVNLTF